MVTRVTVLSCSLVMFVCSAASLRADTFANGGFETADFTGWTVGGNATSGVVANGTPIPNTSVPGNYVHTYFGNYAAYAVLQRSPSVTTFTLTQTVNVTPQQEYDWGCDFSVFGDSPVYADFSLAVSVNGTSYGSGSISQLTNTNISEMGGFVAGAGITSATFATHLAAEYTIPAILWRLPLIISASLRCRNLVVVALRRSAYSHFVAVIVKLVFIISSL